MFSFHFENNRWEKLVICLNIPIVILKYRKKLKHSWSNCSRNTIFRRKRTKWQGHILNQAWGWRLLRNTLCISCILTRRIVLALVLCCWSHESLYWRRTVCLYSPLFHTWSHLINELVDYLFTLSPARATPD